MITDHDRFCLSHVCAQEYHGDARYCPYADKIRAKHGYILPERCEQDIRDIEHPTERSSTPMQYKPAPRRKTTKVAEIPDYLRL